MDPVILLCRLTLAAYFASTLVYAGSILFKRVHTARTATGVFAAAFILHTLAILAAWIWIGHAPLLTIPGGMSFFAWTMAGAYLLFQLRTKTRVLGAFVSPAVFVFVTIASTGLGEAVVIPPVLRNGLVLFHVMFAVMGEALFAVASLAGLMYLIQDNRIKRRKTSPLIRYLPSLRDLDRINHVCLLGGFPLLTLGILLGALWARVAWGSIVQWDPKLLWSFLAWGVYALLLHQRLAIGWKGRRAALCAVVAFVLLLAAFGMEKAFFTTIHRFP